MKHTSFIQTYHDKQRGGQVIKARDLAIDPYIVVS